MPVSLTLQQSVTTQDAETLSIYKLQEQTQTVINSTSSSLAREQRPLIQY